MKRDALFDFLSRTGPRAELGRAGRALEAFTASMPRDLQALDRRFRDLLGDDMAMMLGFVVGRANARGISPEELYIYQLEFAKALGALLPDPPTTEPKP